MPFNSSFETLTQVFCTFFVFRSKAQSKKLFQSAIQALKRGVIRRQHYSTVTDFARLRGLSTSVLRASAV